MKKPYLRTIEGSSGKDCVLIILFQLYGSKAGLFEGNLFRMGQDSRHHHPVPNLHIGRTTKPTLIYQQQFLGNSSIIIPSQKNC